MKMKVPLGFYNIHTFIAMRQMLRKNTFSVCYNAVPDTID